mmetsp:Transcript_17453/g.29829  ORF Transcript_17453/g.29829 Transcript_17453/m.29829 type:complete len:962 (+) Transcript_17453:14-2899(+)
MGVESKAKQEEEEMSRFVRQSQLRNLVVDTYPSEQGFSEIGSGSVQTHGDLIASSAKYISFVTEHNSSSAVGVLDVNKPGKQHGYKYKSTQSGSVYDLKFSPHDVAVFASGAGDGTVALWNVKDGSDTPDIESSVLLDASDRKRVVSMAWHPSAGGVLASLSGNNLHVWDVSGGNEMFTRDIGSETMDGTWNANGSYFACLNKDKSLKLLDPRTGDIVSTVEKAHSGSRSLGRIVSGGASQHGELEHYMYTTGFTLTRDREVVVWDDRKMDAACARTKLGSGTGVLIPIIIPDTKILFLVGKGETSVRAFEGSGTTPFIYNINNNATSPEPFLGCSALPVSSCNVMDCEVSRLYKLSRTKIDSIKIEIPRRLKTSFHDEIFPDSVDIFNAAMSSEEWKNGKDALQPRVPVLKLQKGQSAKDVEKAPAATSSGEQPLSTKVPPPKAQEPEKKKQETVYVASAVDKRMSKLMGYVPKFKYGQGKQKKKESTIYNMKPSTPVAFAVGETKFAVTWQGGGGPVYVGSFADVGKMPTPETVPVLNGHSRPVTCLDFNPFNEDILASGSDDCAICVWDLVTKDSKCLKGHQSAVRLLKFNPTTNGLLASASQDCTVRLWDTVKGEQVGIIDQGEEIFTDICWNYDGTHMATINRNNCMHVVDARKREVISSNEKAHLGAKPCFVTWLGNSQYILTSGCARMGVREFSIWNSEDLSKPVNTTKLGTGATSLEPLYVEENGVVIFGTRGENTFLTYEIQNLAQTSVKPDHAADSPLEPHKCNDFIANGDPTTSVALAPRRALDPSKVEWARLYRLTSSSLDPISFTIPRADDLKEYFADDVYAETKAAEAAIESVDAWVGGETKPPVLVSMNTGNVKRLSSRDPTLAHAAMKKAQANTDRFRRQQEEEDARKRRQDDAFLRMQNLAVQHEAYNPNLSKGSHGHDQAKALGIDTPVEQASEDVEDDEWDD